MNVIGINPTPLSFAVALLVSFLAKMVSSSGVLEVRISAFSNSEARDAAGECCQIHRRERGFDPAGSRRDGRRKCPGECRTFFRACATTPGRDFSDYVHRQQQSSDQSYRERRNAPSDGSANGPTVSDGNQERAHHHVESAMACSIGTIVTDVVANNSLEAHDEGILDIKFPFDIPWPGRVGLILEAWHDVTDDLLQHTGIAKVHDKLAKLVARVAIVDSLEPGRPDWSVHWYQNDHIQLDYALKVDCKHGFDGPACADHTKPTYSHQSSSSTKACVCPEDGVKRPKRDISSPKYDLTSRSAGNQDEWQFRFHKFTPPTAECKPAAGPVDIDSLVPTLVDSVVKRLSTMFMETIDRSASISGDTDFFFSSRSEKSANSLVESPVKLLMDRLTGMINDNAKAFNGLIREDGVIEGRQMVLRVASLLNEAVQMVSPVLTFINAAVTILRATRYLLLMANFMGL